MHQVSLKKMRHIPFAVCPPAIVGVCGGVGSVFTTDNTSTNIPNPESPKSSRGSTATSTNIRASFPITTAPLLTRGPVAKNKLFLFNFSGEPNDLPHGDPVTQTQLHLNVRRCSLDTTFTCPLVLHRNPLHRLFTPPRLMGGRPKPVRTFPGNAGPRSAPGPSSSPFSGCGAGAATGPPAPSSDASAFSKSARNTASPCCTCTLLKPIFSGKRGDDIAPHSPDACARSDPLTPDTTPGPTSTSKTSSRPGCSFRSASTPARKFPAESAACPSVGDGSVAQYPPPLGPPESTLLHPISSMNSNVAKRPPTLTGTSKSRPCNNSPRPWGLIPHQFLQPLQRQLRSVATSSICFCTRLRMVRPAGSPCF
jgi:hypothetical protein